MIKPAALHHFIEHNAAALIFGILIVSMLGGLAQILPVLNDKQTICGQPLPTAVQLAGREIYIRESCGLCHTQQVRPLVAEVLRYGNYSQSSEFVYDRPFLWGSKRTGPDLQRIAGKYSDEWHRIHLLNPRAVVQGSIMPAYPWLADTPIDLQTLQSLMLKMRLVGMDYTDEDIRVAGVNLQNLTEMDAVIAYLQGLGVRPPAMSENTDSNVAAGKCGDEHQH